MGSLYWLFLNILSIIVLGFFSMQEMAFVSFNKIRLQYYLAQGSKRAAWINYLLSHPSRLFGTTLIGVNIALMLGSEFAREFHSSLGIDPDLAPLSQIFLVIIFGELAPQFAARRYSEHVAFLGAPVLYYLSKLMAPFVYILGVISKLANTLLGGKETHQELFLTLEELQKVLEDQEEEKPLEKSKDFETIVARLLRFRKKSPLKVMTTLKEALILPETKTVGCLRRELKEASSFIPIYRNHPHNITGIVYIRNLIRAPDNKKLRDFSAPPWFVTEKISVMELLKQFRRNNAAIACIINKKGQAIGFISLDDLLEDIFGKGNLPSSTREIIDVRVSGDMTIAEFNKKYKSHIEEESCETLNDLFIKKMEHSPEVGDTLYYPPYQLTVKEMAFMNVKSIHVKTKL